MLPTFGEGSAARTYPFFFYHPDFDDRKIEANVDWLVRNGQRVPADGPWPLPRDYNGVTGRERRTLAKKWEIACQRGLVPYGNVCSICAFTGKTQNHNENYFRPCNARPICPGCHRTLHRRFYDPAPWNRLVQKNGWDGAWFTLIGMKELTRDQAKFLATLDNPIDVRQLDPDFVRARRRVRRV